MQRSNDINFINSSRAFTLIEIIAVCAILGILFAISTQGIQLQIWNAKIKAEDAKLDNIRQTIQSSFESLDLEGTNIASFIDSVPQGTDPTQFSQTTDATYIPNTCYINDWYIKIAKQAGFSSQLGTAPTRALQPQIANILMNASGNIRIMLAGPSNEPNQQRFLILSLVAPQGELQMPSLPDSSNGSGYLNFFNDIWNTDWSYSAANLPQSWILSLNNIQQTAWASKYHSIPNINLLRVKRIICNKYSITINNTHPTDNCYIFYNFNGATAANSCIINNNAGVSIIPSILAGRQIQAYRGLGNPPNSSLFSEFTLRDNTEITLQD